MRVTSNTTPNPYTYEYKKAGETQSRFIDVSPELKLVSREGNRLKVEITIPEKPDVEPVAAERVFAGKITRWEDMGVYHIPESSELVEVIPPEPTYAESIYDVPVSDWLGLCSAARDVCNDKLDLEGLTKGEIYNEIRKVFADYLGKDFLEPHYTKSAYGSEEAESGWTIAQHVYSCFNATLKANGIEYGDTSVRREAAGYTGMSNNEIKAAVRERYPEVMTLRQCITMAWELNELGASYPYGNGMTMLLDRTISAIPNMSEEKCNKIYNTLLDMPADYGQMVQNYDNYRANGVKYTIEANKLDPVTRLLNMF